MASGPPMLAASFNLLVYKVYIGSVVLRLVSSHVSLVHVASRSSVLLMVNCDFKYSLCIDTMSFLMRLHGRTFHAHVNFVHTMYFSYCH